MSRRLAAFSAPHIAGEVPTGVVRRRALAASRVTGSAGALGACLAACALALGACTDGPGGAYCQPGPVLPVDRFDFGFVGETTRVALPIGVLWNCTPLPTANVRVRTPDGADRAPLRVEVVELLGNPTALVDFVADVEGTWSLEARFNPSLGQVQREVAIVGDLRAAPLQRFPFVPSGVDCEFPLLTAGGSPLCVDRGVVRWPGTDDRPDAGQAPLPTSSLWVAGERVWLARDSLVALTAIGDGGFALGPALPLVGTEQALSVSGSAERAAVAQLGQTGLFSLDDAGAPRLDTLEVHEGVAVVAVAASGLGAVAFRPASTSSLGATLCQLDARVGDGGCRDSPLFVEPWRTTAGLWFKSNAPSGGFALQFVDPQSRATTLLAGPAATVPLVAAELGARGEPMTALTFTAPSPDGGAPLLLLPRLLDNAVNYEAVLREPAPGLLFGRATDTHVFYRDTRDGGAGWSFVRRAPP